MTHDEKHFWHAYNVNIHDEPSNGFKKTGIKDMIRVARSEKDRGGDITWEAAAKALTSFYGPGKSMFVYRCVVFAQTMFPSWVEAIEQGKLPTSWFLENSFFVGHGGNKAKRFDEH